MSKTQHEIRIEAVYKDLMSQGLNKSKQTLDTFEKKGKKSTGILSAGFDKLRGGVNNLGSSLVGTTAKLVGFGAAVASVGKGVGIFMRTEKAMAEVATISDEVAANIGGVGEQVGDLAIRFGIAEEAVAKALYQTISSGVTEPTEALETLNVALGLSIAGIADSTETTDLLVSTLNAFGDAAGDATNVADVMFSTVRQGKTTIGELAGSLSQVTPTAAALGVTMEETTAAVAAITLSGAPTAEAVTQVRAALTALQKKSKDIDEALRERGVSGGFNLARLRAEGLLPIVRDLRDAYAGNEDELTNLLGQVEATNAVFNLAGDNLDRFQGILDGNTDSAGAYNAALDRMGKTADLKARAAIEGLRQGLAELGEGFIEGILGQEGMAGDLEDAEQAARELRDTLSDYKPILEGIGALVREIGEGIQFWVNFDWDDLTGASSEAVMNALEVANATERAMASGAKTAEDVYWAWWAVKGVMLDVGETGALPTVEKRMARYEEMAREGKEIAEYGQTLESAREQAAYMASDVDVLTAAMLGLSDASYDVGAAMAAFSPKQTATAAPLEAAMPFGPQPDPGFVPWAVPGGGLTVEGGSPLTDDEEDMTKGPLGAAKAWAELKDQVEDTNAVAERFTNNMIDGIAFGMTGAIMDWVHGVKSGEEAFAEFAASFLDMIARMIMQQAILNALSGAFGGGGGTMPTTAGGAPAFGPPTPPGLASGGILGHAEVQGYADGGAIVTKPHLALVGEGHYNEAVVPLPGGREIPVDLRGGGGGGAEVNINISAMDGADAKRVLVKESSTIRMIIEDAIMTTQSTRNAVRQVS